MVSKGGGFKFPNPSKVITFGKNSAMTFAGCNITIEREKLYSFKFTFDGIAVLTGDSDLSGLIEHAKFIGEGVADWELRELLKSSEYLQKASKIKGLEDISKEIISKLSKSEKDSSFEYPFNDFKMDVNKLKRKAEKIGYDASYIDQLLNYNSYKPKDGSLLWYYPDYNGFTLQWILINAFLLLLVTVILLIDRKFDKAFNLLGILKNYSFSGLPIIINGWIFLGRPAYIPFLYWIIPGILLLVCIAIPLVFGQK